MRFGIFFFWLLFSYQLNLIEAGGELTRWSALTPSAAERMEERTEKVVWCCELPGAVSEWNVIAF